MEKKLRSFIAFPLSFKLQDSLQQLQWSVRESGLQARYVKKDNIHLSLKFLGDVAEKGLKKVDRILSAIAKETESFSLFVKGVGVFPDYQKARVLFASLTAAEANLLRLQQRIDKKTAEIGFKEEVHAYHPHLTIARFKQTPDEKKLIDFFKEQRDQEFGQLECREILLLNSELTPKGPQYTVYSKFDLK